MLHKFLGNPVPWHGHYYCVLALGLVAALQFVVVWYVKTASQAGFTLVAVAVVAYLIKAHKSFVTASSSIFLAVWGVRIAWRGIPVAREDIFQRHPVELALNKTLWIWFLSAPTVFTASMDIEELSDAPSILGIALCTLALIVDSLETYEIDGTYTRNPYAFCSFSMAWGLFLMQPSRWTVAFPVLFSCIVLFAPGGTLWLERKRHANSLMDMKTIAYLKSTSPFIPMPSGTYERLPKYMKRIFCCYAY